jgi:L-asparaginase / beta-aspartyl-peptidase
MVRWNLWGCVCVIAFPLIAAGELLAEEAAGPRPVAGPQPAAGPQQGAGGRPAAAGKAPAPDAALRDAIEAVFRAQQNAWNRGDVAAFMDHYWKSDDLTFSSGGKTTRGWQATLDRYRERYPTREKMGRLTLSGFEITPLGDAAALVLGQWKLDRQSEPVGGNFTLVLRKLDGRWVIVHDHTSRLAE